MPETPADFSSALRDAEKAEKKEAKKLEYEQKNQDFVQFPRTSMDAFRGLIRRSPTAAEVMLFLARQMDHKNSIVISADEIGKAIHVSRPTVHRALALLREMHWIKSEVVNGVNLYSINSYGFWAAANTMRGGSFMMSLQEQAKAVMGGSKVSRRVVPLVSMDSSVEKRSAKWGSKKAHS